MHMSNREVLGISAILMLIIFATDYLNIISYVVSIYVLITLAAFIVVYYIYTTIKYHINGRKLMNMGFKCDSTLDNDNDAVIIFTNGFINIPVETVERLHKSDFNKLNEIINYNEEKVGTDNV